RLGSSGGGFEQKPSKPPSHAFVPCTRVGALGCDWPSVHRSCQQSIGGLTRHRLITPPCTELAWPTDVELDCLRSIRGLLPQSIEVFIFYLQSIGGPPVHSRTCYR